MARLDPVTLELVWTRLISAVDEAAKAIVRTSFSTLSNEANDFACVLTDASGRSLAQNTGSIPSFIGTLPGTVRAVREAIPPETMRPGDVFITNNPWIGTGHLNDISIVRPVFHGGAIVGYAATTSHVPDIGGRIRSTEAREIFEEGFHIPPMRLMRDGVADATLLTLLRTNIRTPDQTEGDVWAQVGAVTLIEDRVQRTMESYRLTDLAAVADEIFNRSEAEMRRRIAALPAGRWRYAMQTDGLDQPFTFVVEISIADGEVTADYAGTSPQQPRAVNCVLAYTKAMTAFALKALLLPEVPNNEGIFRPIHVRAPEGSILNPRWPAPVGGRAATGHYVPVLIFGALAEALPDKVRAAPGSPLWIMNIAGTDPAGRSFANVFFFNGGTGAGAAQDGVDCISWPSNISATPIEVAERTAPVLIHHKRLRPGTGGTGRQRGGNGQETLMECEADNVAAVFVTERLRFGAPGLFGGEAGAPGQVLLDGAPVDTRRQQTLSRGTRVTIATPGGGGYG
ncbi:hydantoinase B/oxoprolinase family protein [Falsiroseomonas sp.]|uniref:hydantoinase B/oxoprolinase family protein n=1 Tax=Falsiroseomonas sp. TaxID=2870721 RepID=UPI003562BA17